MRRRLASSVGAAASRLYQQHCSQLPAGEIHGIMLHRFYPHAPSCPTGSLFHSSQQNVLQISRRVNKGNWCKDKGIQRRRQSTEPEAPGRSHGQPSGKKLLTEGEGGAGSPPSGRLIRTGPVTWGSLALLCLTGVGLVAYYDQQKQRRIQEVRQLRPVGKAAIGGPFSLIDDAGKTVTEKDFRGQWNLFYFGFTFCPDICPAELEKMAKAVDMIEKKSGVKVRPVFVSVDPERDTVDQVHEYVKEFHPRMVGLTGSVDAVKQAAREYRVYYMKTEEEGDDYLVDHSIIMYLMDPSMNFVKFFGKNYSEFGLAEGIMEEMRNWKPTVAAASPSP